MVSGKLLGNRELGPMKPNSCQRCGKCCETQGSFFWTSSPLANTNPILILIKKITDGWRDERPCLMLRYDDKGIAYCILQEVFGYEAKPKYCQGYPKDGKCLNG